MDQKFVCRTCLTNTGDLFELFGETGMELGLAVKISEHLRISVDQTDVFTMMCSKCINILNEFHDMYNLAQEIQPHFLNQAEEDVKTAKVDKMTLEGQQEFVEVLTATEFVEQDEHMEEVIIEETVAEEDDEDYDPEEEILGSEEEEEEEVVHGKASLRRDVKAARRKSRAVLSAERIEQEDELIRQTINLTCTDCGMVLRTFEELMFHYRETHKRNGALTCCGKMFQRRVKLLDHAKLHVNPNEFGCPVCHKTFSTKYYLTHHMSVHVPEDECAYQCEKCSKRFPTQSRLNSHMKAHNGYDHKCHICERAFNQKSTLITHVKLVHERTDTHMCEICAKTFKTRDGFNAHQASHMETPPPRVACHICGKKLKNRDTLNQHILRHKHENEEHPCEICKRVFNCKKRLNQHRKYVHATTKLKCEFCDKTFKRPICLKEHVASHTGTVLYTCNFCPRQFNSNANKYSHQKAQHPIEWRMDKLRKEEME